MLKLVEQKHIDEFKPKGASALRGVLSDWVEALRVGITANMGDPNSNAHLYTGNSGEGHFFCRLLQLGSYSRVQRFYF